VFLEVIMLSIEKKLKEDLDRLIKTGNTLLHSIQHECYPEKFREACGNDQKLIDSLVDFRGNYQQWYSESLAIIRQLLPLRYNDFVNLYEVPKNRKNIDALTYRVFDYFQGLTSTRGDSVIAEPRLAVELFRQQVLILKSLKNRFSSSLYDIVHLAKAELYDSEIHACKDLLKGGFIRAAGVIAGVVLEKHLAQIVEDHSLKLTKKNPTIGDYSSLLKDRDMLDIPVWRKIQWLADIRNLCGHKKEREPTKGEVSDLIAGVDQIIKTVF